MKKALIVSLIFFSSLAKSGDIHLIDQVHNGWGSFLGGYGNIIQGLTQRTSLSIFLLNTTTNLENPVYQWGLGDNFPVSFGIYLGVGRSVVQNKYVHDTFTVMDRFLIGVKPKLFFETFGFRVSGHAYFNIMVTNFRQVTPQEYTTILPIKQIKGIFDKFLKRESKKKKTKAQEKEDKEKFKNFTPPTRKIGEREATWGKLWNPITQTFKLPLHYKRALALDDDEIVSYTLMGGVELGASFGAGFDPTNSLLRTGIDVSIFVKGSHQISVLKEAPKKKSDKFVRLKFSRSKEIGIELGIGSYKKQTIPQLTTGKVGALEGNFVWNVIGGIPQIRPFRMQYNWKEGSFYDAIYRFDLNTKEGKEAYNKAAFGFFKLAEKYASDPKTGKLHNKKNMPVTRILSKEEKRTTREKRKSIELFLFRLNKISRIEHSKVTITGEDNEEVVYFETRVLNERARNMLFGMWEERRHKFTINTNYNTYGKKPIDPKSMGLLVEVRIKDTNTDAGEYLDYIFEMEDSLNRPGMFPYPPLGKRGKWFPGSVGWLELKYKLKLNRPQIEKVINYPRKKMWPALIKAFNAKGKGWETALGRAKKIAKSLVVYAGTLPLSATGTKLKAKDSIFVAKMKYSRWKKLKYIETKGPQKLTRELGEFFNSGDYGPEMIKLLRVVLDKEDVPYSGEIKSPLIRKHTNFKFGDVGEMVDPIDKIMRQNFEEYRNFEGIRVRNVRAEILGAVYIRFIFHLNKTPKTVFFNLQRKDILGVFTNKSLGTIVMDNDRKIFKKGENIIHLKINNKKHPLNALVNQLEISKTVILPDRYKINIAASEDGYRYGVFDDSLFRLRYFRDSKALENYNKLSVRELNLCMDKTAAELILFLGERRFLVCPKKAPRNEDGTCKSGMTPYDYISNRSKEYNIRLRNKWIMENCPKEGPDEYIQKIVSKDNICMGKSGPEIIKMLGDKMLYVCPPEAPKNRDKTCKSGMLPYKADIRSRNEWIMKFCPLH